MLLLLMVSPETPLASIFFGALIGSFLGGILSLGLGLFFDYHYIREGVQPLYVIESTKLPSNTYITVVQSDNEVTSCYYMSSDDLNILDKKLNHCYSGNCRIITSSKATPVIVTYKPEFENKKVAKFALFPSNIGERYELFVPPNSVYYK